MVPPTEVPAVLVSTQDLTSVPSETVPTVVQPVGGVRVAARFVVTTSTSLSEVCTEAGTVMLGREVLRSEDAPARHTGPIGGGGASVTSTRRVSESVTPSSSVTVSVTSKAPAASYVYVVVGPAAVSVVPSPKSQS